MNRMGLALCLGGLACGGTQPSPETTDVPGGTSAPYVAADADFMRNMIGHHMQAIEMAALVPDRSTNETVGLLARRIDESQVFEIGLMRRWLEARNEHTGGPHDTSGMAGMASRAQMSALAEADGEAFDRLFLELMIRHHEGALVMLEALQAAEGGGLELELYTLTSHIDADQRAEISRMRRMLNALQ
ncbi:MAG: DUF305 domain-containing protein [Gemmatimonadota bacterium]|nr:DUF305 domain-containing protein [Gemmatimonadota bacterium]